MSQLYDEIGIGYQQHRRPDPRLAAAITRALNQTETVVNVGAGAGSYEPSDRPVVAVEPAMTMIRQRRAGSAPVVQASTTELPFRDDGFTAALAILTVHHWPDRARGLDELARVARRRVVVVTWDPSSSGFWLVDDYTRTSTPVCASRSRRSRRPSRASSSRVSSGSGAISPTAPGSAATRTCSG